MASKTEATASAFWAWSSPSFLCSGLGAGEVVEVVCQVASLSFLSPADRGGKGRRWGAVAICFCWLVMVVLLVVFAPAGRGGEGSSGWR